MKTKQAEPSDQDKIIRPSEMFWRGFRRDRGAVMGSLVVLVIIVTSLFCPWLAPYDPLDMKAEHQLRPPCKQYWFGTDRFGRDQLSRVMYGTRTSMMVSFGSVAIAGIIGVLIGLISGYYGGLIDSVIMRSLDVVFAFPVILLALVIVAIFGPSLLNLLLTVGLIFSPRFARVTRGSVMSIKEMDFIEGARSAGVGNISIMGRFILPNVLSPIIVQATYYLSTAIQLEAALSFLGVGTQPPTPSWGLMLNESRRFMELDPWLAIFPGVAIVLAVLGFNMMGDGLRNAFDPRLASR